MKLTAHEKQRIMEAVESWVAKMPDGYFGKISFDLNVAGGTLGTIQGGLAGAELGTIQGGFTESIRVGNTK